ncbi:MAG: hypothetical protein O9335_09110 [Inhella sp.]|jgi:hypothetical protein|uniref:hypothetical protein n=1 Tax=Inhella sp. TaxID=1921806 RepID=UPI0022CAE8D4|nr:hypothetical protein [Inhella sp.]MCZ8235303.1 hypothetical protein [Inhella sp.]
MLDLLDPLAGALLVLAGVYLLTLGTLAWVRPAGAARYLLGFATTPARHALELTLRLLLAWALWRWSAYSPWPEALAGAAGVLSVTTVGLAVLPWRWHQRFAAWSVPRALPHLRPIGLASAAMGLLLLVAVARGGPG